MHPQEMDDEEANELNDKMQMQYDFGCFIKDELVPNAVKYYTGEAIEDDESYDDEDEEVVRAFAVIVVRSVTSRSGRGRRRRV